MTIAKNLNEVQRKIFDACSRVGRNPDEVKLIVVTKNQPAWKINEVLAAGARMLGENYPEQVVQKKPDIDQNAKFEWHMIGHIQSRKIKYLPEYFSMVHSIDNLETALKLTNACKDRGITLPVCIEVNVAGESSKGGIDVSDDSNLHIVFDLVKKLNDFDNIYPIGLMAMPPFTDNGEENRIYFRRCKQLKDIIIQKCSVPDFCELSMGTSIDFETAIEEGATFVRIGVAIMGLRKN